MNSKKDIVRQYMRTYSTKHVDYEMLYKLVTDVFIDWNIDKKPKKVIIGYLHTYVNQIRIEQGVNIKEDYIEIKNKKDFVRNYVVKSKKQGSVNYEELYELITIKFKDWREANKTNVIRWLKQYVYQINLASNNDDWSEVEFETSEEELNVSDNELLTGSTIKVNRKAKNDKIQKLGHDILNYIKSHINDGIENDVNMYFMLNRFIWVRLRQYEDKLKKTVKAELCEMGLECTGCGCHFRHIKKLELHRIDINKTYNVDNCVLLCKPCHINVHRNL